jgi:hypothetical protein
MSLLPPETSEDRLKRADLAERTELEIVALQAEARELGLQLAGVKKKLADKNLLLHKIFRPGEPMPLFEGNGHAPNHAWGDLPVDELNKFDLSWEVITHLKEAKFGLLGHIEHQRLTLPAGGSLAGFLAGSAHMAIYAARMAADAFLRARAQHTGEPYQEDPAPKEEKPRASSKPSPEAARGSGGKKGKRKQHA